MTGPDVLGPLEQARQLGPAGREGEKTRRETRQVADAGWSSPVARQAHNLKVVGSNPTPATKKPARSMVWRALIFFLSQAKNQLNKNSTFESFLAPDHSLGLSICGLAQA